MKKKDKDKLNALAGLFYRMNGYNIEQGYDFSIARHPQEIQMWEMAKVAFRVLCPVKAKEK